MRSHTESKFQSIDDNLTLEGMLLGSKSQHDYIIFCHGRGENKEGFLSRYASLSGKLIEAGLCVFFFDFRGHGKSQQSKYSFGYFEKRDVLGAVQFLKTTDAEIRNIGILGFSLGAAAAMLAVEKNNSDNKIKAIVSESGYSSFENVAEMWDENGVMIPKKTAYHKAAVKQFKNSKGWMFEISPIKEIEKISPCALFLIDGEKEKEDNLRMFEKAKEPKQIWLIPGAGHGGAYNTAKEEYEDRVLKFFTDFLLFQS